jgi:hypothetical protein
MLRVKLSIRGAGRVADISQFVGPFGNSIGRCEFFVNDDVQEADVWFVSEDVEDWDTTCRVPPSCVAFVSSETSWGPGEYADGTPRGAFIQQFPNVFSCHDIYQTGVVNVPPFLPWMINANHGDSMFAPHERDLRYLRELVDIKKASPISVFCSAQTLTANHAMRLRFVESLKSHFGSTLAWFGNGINPLPEKWEGIAPYRYTIVLENQSTTNVWTEKISDAYLGLAYPIYWGAPNLGDYFDPSAFTTINIRDLAGSIATIERLIDSDVAERNHANLLESKRRVLDEYNFFGRLAATARELKAASLEDQAQDIRICPVASFSRNRRRGVRNSVGRLMTRVGTRLTRSGPA